MKKIRVLLVALLLVCTAAFAVACGVPYEKPPVMYTVTFEGEDGNVVKTVEAEAGKAVNAESIPQAPQYADDTYAFDGWYAGDVKLDDNYLVSADVTFVAKYTKAVYLLTFKNGENTLSTVRVSVGGTLEEADVPNAPAAQPGYEFTGWYNGEDKLAIGYAPDKDATFEAKYEKNAYAVNFVNGEVTTTVYVLYEGDGKVPAAEIPEISVPEGSVALGWYNGDVKLNSEAITEDCTYTAQTVCANDYVGAWYSDARKVYYVVSAEGEVTLTGENDPVAGTFNTTSGAYEFSAPSMYYDNYKLTLLNGKLELSHMYWDAVYESDEVDNYTLTKSEGPSGTYVCHSNNPTVLVDGMIISYKGAIHYGRLTKSENGYNAKVYKTGNDDSLVEFEMVFDEKGNMLAENAIWVAGEKGNVYSCNINDVYNYLIPYTVNGTTLYVYRTGDTDEYVTVEGTVADGNIITIVEKNLEVKLSDGKMNLKGAEAGTYTGADGALVLNGFGNATLGENNYDYTLNDNEVTVNGKVYVLDSANGTYTEKPYIGYEGLYCYSMSSTQNYYVELDGYGTFAYRYNSGSNSYGAYTVADGVITVTDTGTYNYDGTYEILENDNVLKFTAKSSYNSKNGYVFVKEGAVIESKLDAFFAESNGVYVNGEETLTLDKENKQVTYLGTAYAFTGNYNDTELYFKAVYAKDIYGNKCDFTLTLNEEKNLVLSVTYIVSYDAGMEEYVNGTDTIIYNPYKEPNYFLGTYQYSNYSGNYRIQVTETEFKYGKYDAETATEIWDGTSTYTIANGVLTANCISEDWTVVLVEGKEGYISVTSTYTYKTATEFADITLPAPQENPYLGTFKNGNFRIEITETVFKYGEYYSDEDYIDWLETSGTYTIENGVLKATGWGEAWTISLVEGKDGYISVTSESTYTDPTEFRNVNVILYDQLYGDNKGVYEAWAYDTESKNFQKVTFKFNGMALEGSPSVNITWIDGTSDDFAYKLDMNVTLDGTSVRSYCWVNSVSSLVGNGVNRYYVFINEDGTLNAYAASAMAATSDNPLNLVLYKQGTLPDAPVVEEPLDEIAGNWTFGDWSFNFDGKGNVTVNNGYTTTTTTYTYDEATKTATFTYDYETYTAVYNGTTLKVSDEYGEVFGTHECTKA